MKEKKLYLVKREVLASSMEAALKGAGNAIVPQVAGMILRHISLIDRAL